MNWSSEQLSTLAEAFGLLARGAKKIKSVLMEAAKNPDPEKFVEPQVSDTEENGMSDSQSSDGVRDKKSPAFQSWDVFESVLDEDFSETATRHLCSSKMVFGTAAATCFFKAMIRNRMRCNQQKHVWVHTGGCVEHKKNWKRVSTKTAEDVYRRVRDAWLELVTVLRVQTKCPVGIRPSRWDRKQAVINSTFPKTLFERRGFKHILMETHSDLPSLK